MHGRVSAVAETQRHWMRIGSCQALLYLFATRGMPFAPLLHPANSSPASGRKRAALLYVVCYTLGCFTKHAPNFWVLFFGRILCGIATSLLYSAFESWVVGEHNKVWSWVAPGWGVLEAWVAPICSLALGALQPSACIPTHSPVHPLTSPIPWQRGYNPEWLGGIFSQAVFLGNGLVAILAGLFSHSLVDTFRLGPVSPFDAAAIGAWNGGRCALSGPG